ncbi:MAG: type II toxin-antitoxin system PemK/MazF family toxin [Atopobiaceae bacterium]|nr:type II toxin-antitoxin system PemK/MazF family toxin [Atopobiaceae bacterium]
MIALQGELVTLDFSPSVGHEPAKRRPAVVVSIDGFNLRSPLTFVVPITSVNNGYPLHVALPEGLPVSGWACVEQLSGVDAQARNIKSLEQSLDEQTMGEILSLIKGMFGV